MMFCDQRLLPQVHASPGIHGERTGQFRSRGEGRPSFLGPVAGPRYVPAAVRSGNCRCRSGGSVAPLLVVARETLTRRWTATSDRRLALSSGELRCSGGIGTEDVGGGRRPADFGRLAVGPRS